MPDARKVLRKQGMLSKSKERNRRPTLAELDKLRDWNSESYGSSDSAPALTYASR